MEVKDALRLTSDTLRMTPGGRLALDACTLQLTYRGGCARRIAPRLLSLEAVLPALCQSITLLDLRGFGKSLVHLSGCPSTLQTLRLSGTRVADLSPLEACTRLRALDCDRTKVANLRPLEACTGLRTLSCDNSEVTDLGPLKACTGLQALHCYGTLVADLGPLAASTGLQSLHCNGTKVACLGPLAA